MFFAESSAFAAEKSIFRDQQTTKNEKKREKHSNSSEQINKHKQTVFLSKHQLINLWGNG